MGQKQAQITSTLPLALSSSNILTVDLSTYYTKSQVDNLISGGQTNLSATSNLSISTLTTQGANAISVYNGANKTAAIYQDGSATCTQISTTGAAALMVGNGASVNASITSLGNITCVGLATGTLIASGIGGLSVYSDTVKTASISQAGLLTAKSMSMAYTNAALAFNSTSGLSYTYNNQLTGASLISTTLSASSSGIKLDHSGQKHSF